MPTRLRPVIYKLKRLHGRPVDLYKQGTKAVNSQTGVITWTARSVINLRHVIVLPVKMTREQINTVSMTAANRPYVYGGMFDKGKRYFYIDPRDLPSGYEIERDDWLVYRGRQYEISSSIENEFDLLHEVLGSELEGVVPEQVLNRSGYSIVELNGAGGVAIV